MSWYRQPRPTCSSFQNRKSQVRLNFSSWLLDLLGITRVCGRYIYILVGGLEHFFMTFHMIGNVIIPPDFHSKIFQRGRYTTNQIYLMYVIVVCKPSLKSERPHLVSTAGAISLVPWPRRRHRKVRPWAAVGCRSAIRRDTSEGAEKQHSEVPTFNGHATGTDSLEVPIPYIFGLFFRAKF